MESEYIPAIDIPRRSGRPTTYNSEVAEYICNEIARGRSLRKICDEDGMPCISTVCLWLVKNVDGFSEQYTIARKAQAWLWADEMMEIADDSSQDKEIRDGQTVTNHEVIGRSRLRVDTRKWYLSKVLPKIFGEKSQMILSGDDDGGPVQTVTRIELIPLKSD